MLNDSFQQMFKFESSCVDYKIPNEVLNLPCLRLIDLSAVDFDEELQQRPLMSLFEILTSSRFTQDNHIIDLQLIYPVDSIKTIQITHQTLLYNDSLS